MRQIGIIKGHPIMEGAGGTLRKHEYLYSEENGVITLKTVADLAKPVSEPTVNKLPKSKVSTKQTEAPIKADTEINDIKAEIKNILS